MRWHTKPITQLVVMFVVMGIIVTSQQVVNMYAARGQTPTSLPIAQLQDEGLVQVQAQAAPTCPNTDPIQYAWTENNTQIAPPKRMRYVDARWEYDSLNTSYFSRVSLAQRPELYGGLESNITYIEDGGPNDVGGGTGGTGITNMMSSMFRYKPDRLKDAYVLLYQDPPVPRGADTPHKGSAPAIEVPSNPGWPVCAPTTGYDVGGGYEAMVVFADANRITLHVGIHEYMDGQDARLGVCPTGPDGCKGGYWIYVSGIAVDSDIIAAYNEKKGVQQGSNLSNNISDRIELPIIKPGRRLGASQGSGVVVAVRDSGPLIKINEPFLWNGFPTINFTAGNVSTPTAGAATPISTNTPIPSNTPAPTITTPVPTGTTPTVTPDPALPCGHGLWRYTCSESGTFVNEAKCIAEAYTIQGSSSTCSPGTSCPSLTVNYSATQLPNFGVGYCVPNIPTPPAGGAPSPTIQVELTSIHFIFEGTCSSNPLCNHLYSLRHPSYQSGQGTMTINSDPENFLLGGHIRILPPSTVQHITISLLTDSVPELSAWTSARILLPPSAEFPQQIYIIK
jgi:hypothetical protein